MSSLMILFKVLCFLLFTGGGIIFILFLGLIMCNIFIGIDKKTNYL